MNILVAQEPMTSVGVGTRGWCRGNNNNVRCVTGNSTDGRGGDEWVLMHDQ